jgi:hypothetical protein
MSRRFAKIAKSWVTRLGRVILVGPVSTRNHSNAPPEKDAAALARTLLGPMWPRVRRIPLIRREVRETLSDNALELLFGSAELLVEGERDLDGARGSHDRDRAYATVMVTLDLTHCASLLREPADEATAERVAELMQLIELARPKLAELVEPFFGEPFFTSPPPSWDPHGDARGRALRIELLPVVRVVGARILIDGDVVVSLRSRSEGKEGRG